MANLGNFAGGLAQGLQTGQRLKLAKQELEYNQKAKDRQLGMQEEQHGWDKLDRETSAKMSEELSGIYKTTFGDNPVETMKRDPEAMARFSVEKIALGIRYNKADPKEILAMGEKIREMAQSEEYRDVMAAVGGNPEAKARVLPKIGLDPTKEVRYVQDPKTGRYMATDGTKSVDVSATFQGMGLLKAAEYFEGLAKGEREMETHRSNLRSKDAVAASGYASAAASKANANLTNVRAKNLGSGTAVDSKVGAAVRTAVDSITRNMKDPLTGQVDQMVTPNIRQIALGLVVSGKTRDPEAAAVTAANEYQQMLQQARTLAAQQPREVFKQYGGTPEAFARQMVQRAIDKKFPMVADDAE
jgi:hypothetical protein